MPYIKQGDRDEIEKGRAPAVAGELNYVYTRYYIEVYKTGDMTGLESRLWDVTFKFLEGKEMRYDLINTVIGAIECSRIEFFFRILPSVNQEEDSEAMDWLSHFDERVSEFKVAVYNKIGLPYEAKKREENGDVYSS
jgi:hypothetical protein